MTSIASTTSQASCRSALLLCSVVVLVPGGASAHISLSTKAGSNVKVLCTRLLYPENVFRQPLSGSGSRISFPKQIQKSFCGKRFSDPISRILLAGRNELTGEGELYQKGLFSISGIGQIAGKPHPDFSGKRFRIQHPRSTYCCRGTP